MIYLIGGSSHVGKTYISQKLIERYHYPCTSLDHLKMGFIRTGKTNLTVEDDYEMRYFLWPFVAEMIKTAIENNQNLIIEGCYIPGEWQQSFEASYLEHIRCVFVVMSSNYIRTHADLIALHASVIERRINDEIDIERLTYCSENFKAEAVKYGFPYYEITEEYNIDKIMEEITKILES